MRGTAQARPSKLLIDTQRLRLGSGLALALFLAMHFVNLALGLVSIAAMEAAAPWLMAPWRSPPGTLLLYGALAVHFALTLRVLHKRRTLRMSGREGAQLALGLLLPVLLTGHVVETRIGPGLTGQAVGFAQVVKLLWVKAPPLGGQQVIALVISWGHACLGIWFWLRTKTWFPQAAGPLLAGAVLVPIMALLGYAEAGKAAADLPIPPIVPLPDLGWIRGSSVVPAIQGCFGLALVAVLGSRLARQAHGRRRKIRVTYPQGRVVTVPAGHTILEASRLARVPHASVCGGRGRCSTCRIRVLRGLSLQPPPSSHEAATLERFGADPDVRLACQLRPSHDLAVHPIFPPAPDPMSAARARPGSLSAREREVAILFCDLRGFTRRAEQWLPFDTVYLLNRYFGLVGRAIEDSGGRIDKFIGDGALALFGLDVSSELACRQAVQAAAAIARALDEVNAEMIAGHHEPLRVAIGLHAGPAIVGEMGYGQAIGLTAVGDAINVASRLEGAAKEFDIQAVMSAELARRAGLDSSVFPSRLIAVRGRVAPVETLLVEYAAALSGMAEAT